MYFCGIILFLLQVSNLYVFVISYMFGRQRLCSLKHVVITSERHITWHHLSAEGTYLQDTQQLCAAHPGGRPGFAWCVSAAYNERLCVHVLRSRGPQSFVSRENRRCFVGLMMDWKVVIKKERKRATSANSWGASFVFSLSHTYERHSSPHWQCKKNII